MPAYDFECKECNHIWEELTQYDPTDQYEEIKCPECGLDKKEKLVGGFAIGGPTKSKMNKFGYRAGYNMDKAKGERRAAEDASHVGASPYSNTDSDFNLGEGIHDPTTRGGLS